MRFFHPINIVVSMIPGFSNDPSHTDASLPVGMHWAALREVEARFSTSIHRAQIFAGFRAACIELAKAGCRRIVLGGSYITEKLIPSDIDVVWDTLGVNPSQLDSIFLDQERRTEMATLYRGDYLPGINGDPGTCPWVKYFTKDKKTGAPRGTIAVKLKMIELLN